MKFLIILIIQASLSQLLFAGPGVRGDYVQIPDDPNMPSRPQSKKSTQDLFSYSGSSLSEGLSGENQNVKVFQVSANQGQFKFIKATLSKDATQWRIENQLASYDLMYNNPRLLKALSDSQQTGEWITLDQSK